MSDGVAEGRGGGGSHAEVGERADRVVFECFVKFDSPAPLQVLLEQYALFVLVH